jgi:hypothetical protein
MIKRAVDAYHDYLRRSQAIAPASQFWFMVVSGLLGILFLCLIYWR